MRPNRIFLAVTALAAVIAVAGCDPASSTAGSATTPATAGSDAAAAPSTSATPSAEPADDAATTKACADLKKDIKDNASQVAKAEKIGPPAGHIAVSAQWTAGSTAVIAHSIGANDKVSAAADVVQQEMMNIGDAYNKSSSAKPGKSKLNAAIADLNAACAAA